MIASFKKLFKWNTAKDLEVKKNHTSLLLAAILGVLEDILFWNNMWLSLSFIFFLNTLFFVCIHQQISILEIVFVISLTILSIDAFEAWLKYKHRTGFLKKLASNSGNELNLAAAEIKTWARRKWLEFVYLRETNHTKAFLLINIILSIVFLLGKYINGYIVIYLISMFICLLHKLAPPLLGFLKKVHQNAESDGELEGLIPEVSDVDIKLLSIEPEPQIYDDRQSLDYWKPHDLPIEDASDSSDNSSSLVTNLSMDKMHTLEKDVETSDSSEDEYIPLVQQKEQLKSTLEVVQPVGTWSGAAYNAFFNFTGAVANMVYSAPDQKRERVSSIDSSDGFEMIDKNDLN